MCESPAAHYYVRLPVRFLSPATGASGEGVTQVISREGVVFAPADPNVRVGDVLHYVLMFPGHEGRAGAVARCCGRVSRADGVIAVTIDRYRLQTADAARACGGDARRLLHPGLSGAFAHPPESSTCAGPPHQ
jgi:hypothetical protein